MKLSFKIVMCLLLAASCSKKPYLKPYQDPYFDSFKGKSVRYMIGFDSDDSTNIDTVFFDEMGNAVEFKSFGGRERRSYDSLHFIRRLLRLDDTPSNYFVEYYFNAEKKLVQEWREVNHLNWSNEKSQISKVSRVIVFEIDKSGRIIQEIDSVSNELALYSYNNNGTLSTKEISSIKPQFFLVKWSYIYDNDGKLKMISLDERKMNILTHYYSNGLLDSTVYTSKGYTTKYKYIYY